MRNGLEIDSDDNKFWYLNDKLHRLDGPAVIRLDGTKAWYLNGELHRLDGPAVISSVYVGSGGTKYWFVNGKKHRLDGPAVISSYGTKQWWIHDIEYTEEEYNEMILTRWVSFHA